MNLEQRQIIRITKRLTEAEGYLELRMAQQAIDRLDGLGELGPLEPAVAMLRGKAMWQQHRYDEAVESLRQAVLHMHAPLDRPAWLALSVYYRDSGRAAEAVESLARARGAQLPNHPRSEK